MTAFQTWDEPRPVKLTIADFLRLEEAGALDGYAKTELIDGRWWRRLCRAARGSVRVGGVVAATIAGLTVETGML